MYLGLCLIGLIAAVWTITAMPTRSRSNAVPPRDLERRDAHLRACPDRVTQGDLDRVLRAHPLSEPSIVHVLGAAAERGIGLRTLWCWADRFGADKLVLAVDAEVGERRLRRYLESGTTPDWASLSVFADLARDSAPGSLPLDEVLDLDSVPHVDALQFDLSGWETPEVPWAATPELDLSQFDHLPPIYDPGLPLTQSIAPPDGSRGDKGWPQVA